MQFIKHVNRFTDSTAFIKVENDRAVFVGIDGTEKPARRDLIEDCIQNIARGTWVVISEQEAMKLLRKKIQSFKAGDVFKKMDNEGRILVAEHCYVNPREEQKYVFLGLFGSAGRAYSTGVMNAQEVLACLNKYEWQFEKHLSVK
jgi:hypothetical protein